MRVLAHANGGQPSRRDSWSTGVVCSANGYHGAAMNLLAIETATEACSVALIHGDEVIARSELAPRRHAERVLPMADELLAEAGLGKHALNVIAVAAAPAHSLAYASRCRWRKAWRWRWTCPWSRCLRSPRWRWRRPPTASPTRASSP